AGEPYACPLARVEQVMPAPQAEIVTEDGRSGFFLDGQRTGLISARHVWQLPDPEVPANPLPVVVLSNGDSRCAVAVDALLGESDIIVRPLGSRLGRVPGRSAGAVLRAGA